MLANHVFKGVASMEFINFDLELRIDSVTDNEFTFSQILSQNGEILEQSGGQGTFSQVDDKTYQVVFHDELTNFVAEYSPSLGYFVGTAEQKDGSGKGTLNLQCTN